MDLLKFFVSISLREIYEILVLIHLFLLLFTALTDHSATCSERIVDLHEAALEEIEKESDKNGTSKSKNNGYKLTSFDQINEIGHGF